jgi:acetyl-CoA C-acetyltransferase
MSLAENTPIIIGVGQVVEAVKENVSEASSPIDLAVQAAQLAMRDALDNQDADTQRLAAEIDVLATVRTTADSIPLMPAFFGTSNNPPRSVAQRINASPSRAIHTASGGNTPQKLVNEWCEALADGEANMVLLTGAEAVATTKAALKAGVTLDWAETIEGSIEDRGLGIKGMIGVEEIKHQLMNPTTQYALCENARRAQQGQSLADYYEQIGQLFAPFSQVAASNPYAMFQQAHSAESIAKLGADVPFLDYPYTKAVVAKDGVNQAAAVLLTTVGKAKALGIDETKWVYLHGYADAEDLPLIERENLARSKALELTYQRAIACANVTSQDIDVFDVYSCFPIVVWLAQEALQLGGRKVSLTQTGGLPFFGGPGNNYSMHGIASVVEALRKAPNAYGLVGANGGMINKHSVGVYSCQPGWQHCDSSFIQAEVRDQVSPANDFMPQGHAIIESYTVAHRRGEPKRAVIAGRMKNSGARFLANNHKNDTALLNQLLAQDMVGVEVVVETSGAGNTVALTVEALRALIPKKKIGLQKSYEFCVVETRGHVLEITINRPEVYNALHPMANEEMSDIFDAYFADENLWVAIITGAGDKSFSAGNDLKYSASGQPFWVPHSGFGGLTSRQGRTKPVIAAVNGFAHGGGMEIALACDIIIADETAEFALPEVKRGLIAAGGGIVRIARQIPLKQAMDILLSGRNIEAGEAQQLGFVNQVVAAGGSLAAARDYAAMLCENSPSSIRLTLELLAEKSSFADAAQAAAANGKVFDQLITSEDFYEGPQAFAQKRKPKWSWR